MTLSKMSSIEKFIFMEKLAEAVLRIDLRVQEINFDIFTPVIEELYDAFCRVLHQPLPCGEIDVNYAVNNIPYLVAAYQDYIDEEGWAYRLYVPFSGQPSSEKATPQWHCRSSWRFEEEREFFPESSAEAFSLRKKEFLLSNKKRSRSRKW